MFEKKQIIYSETQGVCQVENIVSLSASRRERKIPYYVLRPVFDKSRVSYIPVENHQVKLRELFTREEAEALQGTEEMKKDVYDRFEKGISKLDNEMIRTMEVFFKCGLNLSEAAKELYIHRNTLIYRLDKIQKYTNYDIRDFNDAVLLKIIFFIWKEKKS